MSKDWPQNVTPGSSSTGATILIHQGGFESYSEAQRMRIRAVGIVDPVDDTLLLTISL